LSSDYRGINGEIQYRNPHRGAIGHVKKKRFWSGRATAAETETPSILTHARGAEESYYCTMFGG
jgi:hypothetical protein